MSIKAPCPFVLGMVADRAIFGRCLDGEFQSRTNLLELVAVEDLELDFAIDTGAVIAQRTTPVFHDDDEAALSARVKVEEHRLYPDVLTLIAEGRVHLKENGVEVRDAQDLRVC